MYRPSGQHASWRAGPSHQNSSPVGLGILISLVTVLSTAIAHCIATSYIPTFSSLILALVVLVPTSIALASISLTRSRLLGTVAGGQALLHGFFSLSAGIGSTEIAHSLLTNVSCSAVFAHMAALGLTYAAVRRGDEFINFLHDLTNFSSSLVSEPPAVSPVSKRVGLISGVWSPVEGRPGDGPQPRRGPPALVL